MHGNGTGTWFPVFSDADPVELFYGDPRSGNPPYKSGSKEKTSHKIQFFKILWKKAYLHSYRYRTEALYKIG